MQLSNTWPLAVALAFAGAVPAIEAQPMPVKILKQGKGSVADEALQKEAPQVITSAKALERLWSAWKLDGKAPEVDFTKEFVVVGTTRGSNITLSPRAGTPVVVTARHPARERELVAV